ncbi:MAG: ABC transporter permease [Candidatus Palauibacterales bacterium]|jgi:putative ABC transport system permease protein|nr:ABC transporter permease [Candidatus Palauibacterales bacterium]MDP2483788.1 ABC transporter permease [Candidatus Palauibacterales bacterium]
MLIFEIIRVALQAIGANKMRSLLTMLGIVIGVGAVITMVALGNGAQQAVESQLEALGTNVLTVRPGQGWHRGVRGGDERMYVTDAYAVEQSADAIRLAAPEMVTNAQVEFGRSNASMRVTGTTESFAELNNYAAEYGRFFTAAEDAGRRRVAVLGGAVPEMFSSTPMDMLGKSISIRNVTFEVVGVLEAKGGSGWFNQDERIFIPIQTAQFRIMGTDRIGSFNVLVADGYSQTAAMAQIEQVMRREHKLRVGVENDFYVQDRAELMGTMQEATQTFTFLLAGIAAVSLLVGGIGIMNIMLVSVTERTREIGIRMAMGATRRQVLTQFLLEALVLCLVGGLVGIGLGFGASKTLAELANWTTAVSPRAVGMAVVFSAVVGLFFGAWPARRAAGLDPIEALRYE